MSISPVFVFLCDDGCWLHVAWNRFTGCVNEAIMLYTLKLHIAICQLNLDKIGGSVMNQVVH